MILGNRYPASLSRKHLWDPARERGRERREGRADGGRDGACLTSATINCSREKPGKNKRVREERKTAPTELHYCGGKEREQKRGEERRERGEEGKRGGDNGVNASRHAAAVLGLITHTRSLGREEGGKPAFDLQLIH